MWTAFPPSDYYADSATPRAHQRTSRLAGGHRQPGAHGALPTFTMIRLTGSATGSTATAMSDGHSQSPAGHHAQINQPSVERAAV